MTIIVENGSNVANANSYITVATLRDYATARGVTLPADPACEPLLIKAVDYINSFRGRYQGTKTYSDQTMLFPRNGMTIDGETFPKDAIPQELKDAQAQAAIYAATTDLNPITTGAQVVKREKIGPIDTEYSETLAVKFLDSGPSFPLVDVLLEPLFGSQGGFFITTVRA